MQNSQAALGELNSFRTGRRKSGDILQEQQTRLGLPSAQQRQAGLRLDLAEEAAKRQESGLVAVVPGDVAKSALITRIMTADEQFQCSVIKCLHTKTRSVHAKRTKCGERVRRDRCRIDLDRHLRALNPCKSRIYSL